MKGGWVLLFAHLLVLRNIRALMQTFVLNAHVILCESRKVCSTSSQSEVGSVRMLVWVDQGCTSQLSRLKLLCLISLVFLSSTRKQQLVALLQQTQRGRQVTIKEFKILDYLMNSHLVFYQFPAPRHFSVHQPLPSFSSLLLLCNSVSVYFCLSAVLRIVKADYNRHLI